MLIALILLIAAVLAYAGKSLHALITLTFAFVLWVEMRLMESYEVEKVKADTTNQSDIHCGTIQDVIYSDGSGKASASYIVMADRCETFRVLADNNKLTLTKGSPLKKVKKGDKDIVCQGDICSDLL